MNVDKNINEIFFIFYHITYYYLLPSFMGNVDQPEQGTPWCTC